MIIGINWLWIEFIEPKQLKYRILICRKIVKADYLASSETAFTDTVIAVVDSQKNNVAVSLVEKIITGKLVYQPFQSLPDPQ